MGSTTSLEKVNDEQIRKEVNFNYTQLKIK